MTAACVSQLLMRWPQQGVLAGIECGEALICPSEPLKRWEMAVWLVRVLDGADPGAPSLPSFPDVDYDEWWAPFVERLLEMGVTTGCGRDTLQYCPGSSVTRAQMASFLARALGLIELPASVRFTAIDAGYEHTCGLRADSTIACWGGNWHGQSDAPDGEFQAMSVGQRPTRPSAGATTATARSRLRQDDRVLGRR